MPLDMFQQTQSDTDAYVAQQTSPRLPVELGEAFEKSWNENRLFGQSTAVLNAHSAALGDYLDEVHRKSGVLISPLNQMGDQKSLDEIGFDVGELRKKRPDLDIPDLTDDDIDRRAVAKSRQARTDYQDMSAAEKTGGGKFGSVLGGLAGGITDPVNLVAAPLAAPESLGLLGTALAWGAIAGTTQAANEAIGSPYRDKVQPGYSQSAEPAQNILEAAGFGAVTGGGFKALGNVWTRAKTGTWPRSVRDAGNVVESEANVAQTNVLDGLPGEVAHRDALAKTVDDITAGRPTDVGDIVTPDLTHDPEKVDALHEHAKPFIEAYHGSPHDFEAFSMDKIGTGEGAQAYGHGLYFAENPSVAQNYAIPRTGGGMGFVGKLSDLPTANTYTVRINADKEHFLDLDKRLNEQTPFVQSAVKQAMGIDYYGKFDQAKSDRLWNDYQYADGKTAVRNGFIAFDDPNVTQKLSDAGIPGSKYLDAGSRTEGEGSRNYVVFDDKHVQITHKNGVEIGSPARIEPETVAKDLAHEAPDQADAMLHDLDKQLAEGDHQIPTGVDQEGNPVFRSFKDMLDEVKADRESAGHLEACLTGADEEPANAE